MSTTLIRRTVLATLAASSMLLAATVPAAAATYTKRFVGEGSSDFGFARYYAEWDATRQAKADGFNDPRHQCVEVFALESPYAVTLIWECSREI